MIGSAVASTPGHDNDDALVPCTHAVDHSLPMMVAMCRLLRETYEPEQLTPSSMLKADPQGNAVLEVIFWMVSVAELSSWPNQACLLVCIHVSPASLPFCALSG